MCVQIEIRRTNRKKSVGFAVRWPDTLMVSAPARMDKKAIDEIIADRLPWAEKRLAKLVDDYKKLGLPKGFVAGESYPYLGKQYPLTVMVSGDRRRPRCSLEDGRFTVEVSASDEFEQSAQIKKAINKWYRGQAQEELLARIARWAPEVSDANVSAQIRNQRTRWGSCSKAGKINLNWRLILLPLELGDYVIVHELCHLINHDHSPRFWSQVAKLAPEYKQYRRLLRRHAPYLDAF